MKEILRTEKIEKLIDGKTLVFQIDLGYETTGAEGFQAWVSYEDQKTSARFNGTQLVFSLELKILGKKLGGLNLTPAPAIIKSIMEVKAQVEREKKADIESTQNFVPEKVQFCWGGDSYKVLMFQNEYEGKYFAQPKIFAELKKIVDNWDRQTLEAKATRIEDFRGIYQNSGCWEVAVADVLAEKKPEEKIENETTTTNYEGAIAFNRCWECGCAKIVGKIVNGIVARMEKSEWEKAQTAFESAWASQFEEKTEILSSVGTKWQETYEKMGFKSVIVSQNYDGC